MLLAQQISAVLLNIPGPHVIYSQGSELLLKHGVSHGAHLLMRFLLLGAPEGVERVVFAAMEDASPLFDGSANAASAEVPW